MESNTSEEPESKGQIKSNKHKKIDREQSIEKECMIKIVMHD